MKTTAGAENRREYAQGIEKAGRTRDNLLVRCYRPGTDIIHHAYGCSLRGPVFPGLIGITRTQITLGDSGRFDKTFFMAPLDGNAPEEYIICMMACDNRMETVLGGRGAGTFSPGTGDAGRSVFFKRTGSFPEDAVDTDNSMEIAEETGMEKAYICRFCGNVITFPGYAMEIDGSRRHTFTNPAGIVYEIECFSSARGCAVAGEPTLEFTWFPGFYWTFALCSGCRNHMGWYYEKGGAGFYGLVIAYLAENW